MPNYAWDFDQTLTRAPASLGELISLSQSRSAVHYILTGRPVSDRKNLILELRKIGLDDWMFKDLVMFPEVYTLPQFSHDMVHRVCAWKAKMCKKMDIDILFEDNIHVIDPIKRISPKTRVAMIF